MTNNRHSNRIRLVSGSLVAVASLFLCGSAPATIATTGSTALKVSVKESQFALATVNDVNKQQRSEMLRLAAKYPQLFIQASAGQLANRTSQR